MKRTNLKTAAAIGLAGLALSASSNAAITALIDWSRAQVAPSPDTNGNHWNSLGSGTDLATTTLASSTNTSTPWSIAVDNTGPSSGFSGAGVNGTVGATAPFNTTGANRPTTDGIFVNQNSVGTSLITITGLTPSSVYDFSAIGGRASGGNNGFIKVITGAFGSGGSDIDLIDSDNLLDTFTLLNNATILNFQVTADSSGVVAFRFFENDAVNNADNSATFNALSITGVPEPSTALLGGLGLLALLRRRRA